MKFTNAAITTDVIVYNLETKQVLLIERKNDPFKGYLALPGGYFNAYSENGQEADSTVKNAAIRELYEETRIMVPLGLSFFMIADDIGRDPRGRTISHIYTCLTDSRELSKSKIKAGDDAANIKWIDISEINKHKFAFDHAYILNKFKFAYHQ